MNIRGVRVAHIAWTFGLNGIPEPPGKSWAVNVFDPRVPTVEGMLADAAAARRAGAEVVIVSVHCCTEYQADPQPAQLKIAATLLASPDVELVIGHHAHVVQPLERINGKWVAYGLGNHVAEQTNPATNDSVITRFTFTRGTDNHFTITAAQAVPTRIQHTNNSVVVVPTKPGDPSYRRVAQVLESRGAANAGLLITGP
jgi:poly-gamma-glutamate capsule biosynthesis protein CapA/YwtB (metallophosphatase superfamily)